MEKVATASVGMLILAVLVACMPQRSSEGSRAGRRSCLASGKAGAVAGNGTQTIRGQVLVDAGTARGIEIVLSSQSRELARVTSACAGGATQCSAGDFAFVNLTPGIYELTFGYGPLTLAREGLRVDASAVLVQFKRSVRLPNPPLPACD